MIEANCFADQTIEFGFDEDIQDYFLNGQCPALAYEIHKLTGWTLAMVSSAPQGSPDYLAHVFIMDSNGLAVDIKGRRSLDELKDEWYFAEHVHRFWNLKEFEYEMLDWCLSTRFNRDKEAKIYARKIVDILS